MDVLFSSLLPRYLLSGGSVYVVKHKHQKCVGFIVHRVFVCVFVCDLHTYYFTLSVQNENTSMPKASMQTSTYYLCGLVSVRVKFLAMSCRNVSVMLFSSPSSLCFSFLQ